MKNLRLISNRTLTLGLALSMLAGFSSCDDDDDVMPAPNNVGDVLEDDANFTVLSSALDVTGLDDALNGAGPFTVFAPADAAFGDFIAANNLTAAALLGSSDLANTLSYHVVSGNITSGDVKAGPVSSLTGDKFYVSVDPTGGV